MCDVGRGPRGRTPRRRDRCGLGDLLEALGDFRPTQGLKVVPEGTALTAFTLTRCRLRHAETCHRPASWLYERLYGRVQGGALPMLRAGLNAHLWHVPVNAGESPAVEPLQHPLIADIGSDPPHGVPHERFEFAIAGVLSELDEAPDVPGCLDDG